MKVVALLLDAVGGGFIFFGLSVLFERPTQKTSSSPEQAAATRRRTAGTLLSFVVAILPPVVAGIVDALLR